MGVNGLTQFLRPIYVKRRVKDLRGSTFGVDAMAWLYRGFYGQKYANNDINERFLSFYYRMLAQLRKYDIKVSFFFPSKAGAAGASRRAPVVAANSPKSSEKGLL